MANVALMWIAVELTTLLSAFLVGFRRHPGGARSGVEICRPDDARRRPRAARLPDPVLGIAARRLRALHLGRARCSGAAHAAGVVVARLSVVLVGFGTKVGLVPLHTWLPDAHSQAPAPICALLSGVETTTVLYVILRLFPVARRAPGLDARPWFIGFGLLSVAVATLLLIYVRDFKRMFAFSTVEHMGIILVAAGLGGADAHLGAAYPADRRTPSPNRSAFSRPASRCMATGHPGHRHRSRADRDRRRLPRWRSSPAASRSPARRLLPSSSANSPS